MATRTINCVMEIDDATETVTIRSKKHQTILASFKIAECFGTFARIEEDCDCDNYWIAIKPADSEVFENRLFGRTRIQVTSFSFNYIR